MQRRCDLSSWLAISVAFRGVRASCSNVASIDTGAFGCFSKLVIVVKIGAAVHLGKSNSGTLIASGALIAVAETLKFFDAASKCALYNF